MRGGSMKEYPHRSMISLAVMILAIAAVLAFCMPAVTAQNDTSSNPVNGAGESKSDYHNNPWTYLLFSFIMTFGLVSVLAGLFALKFGQKGSRKVALPMVFAGMVPWGTWFYFHFITHASYPNDTVFDIIHWVAAPLLKPFMAVLGVVLGAGLAVFIFLTAIVRS